MALPRVSRRTVLSLRHFAEAVFSSHGAPPPSDRLEFTVAEYEQLLAYGGFRTRLLIGLCLRLIGLLASLFVGRLRSTWKLPLPDRVKALARMEAHPVLGSPVLAVKAALCIIYYEHPASAAEVGILTQGVPQSTSLA